MGKVKDISGQKFGRLTAIKIVGYKKDKRAIWYCHCDCGNNVNVCGTELRSGHTKSCGCLQKELLVKRNKDMAYHNTYDLSGEYGIGYDVKGKEFYFDLDDYDKIKDYYWSVNNNGYVTTSNNQKHLHRTIMNVDNKQWTCVQVDHIHGNDTRNDNRKSNLRIVTPSQNGMNKKIYSNNTTGYTGVYWNKKNK